MTKPRARELGLPFPGTPGRYNAITDVDGISVGMTTLIDDDADRPVRTGVTAILPFGENDEPRPIWAGVHSLNGNGELTGSHWIADGGYFASPICITNTHSVGIAHHATVRWMLDRYDSNHPDAHIWCLPVIAETYDGLLNDIRGQHLHETDVMAALKGAASGSVAEGNVGGGTGMMAYEFKGGTGTASRLVETAGEAYVVGALVQANHGIRDWLTVLGVPVGKHLRDDRIFSQETGSIIVIIATDAPMLPHQLQRLARRATIGIGRGGTVGGNNSGDIFLAFSVANKGALPSFGPPLLSFTAVNDEEFDPFYQAAVEATEEAVVNAMVAAADMRIPGKTGSWVRAIDHTALREVMGRYNRLGKAEAVCR